MPVQRSGQAGEVLTLTLRRESHGKDHENLGRDTVPRRERLLASTQVVVTVPQQPLCNWYSKAFGNHLPLIYFTWDAVTGDSHPRKQDDSSGSQERVAFQAKTGGCGLLHMGTAATAGWAIDMLTHGSKVSSLRSQPGFLNNPIEVRP